jgi:hypothetical protein
VKEEGDFLARLMEKLEAVGIPYMVVGSLASGLYGQLRSTHDVDMMIAPSREQLQKFAASLGTGYYISTEAAFSAFETKGMFNIIDEKSGWKADLIIRKEAPFHKIEFERRVLSVIFDVPTLVATAEDTILSKLVWSKAMGGSERQLSDIKGIIVVQKDALDGEYLHKWAEQLGVADDLEAILTAVGRAGV